MGETVLVKRGNNGSVYHKHDESGVPPCYINDKDASSWMEWNRDKAEVWKTPCQNPDCYGDNSNHAHIRTGDTGTSD